MVAFPTETVYGLGADATEPGGNKKDLSGPKAGPRITLSSSILLLLMSWMDW